MPRHELTFSTRWRETFGRVDPEQTAREVAFLRRVLPLPEFPRVLDVPCGFGRHMGRLAGAGYSVVGIDNDPDVVAEGQGAGLDARVGDMRDLTSLPRDFDAVLNMWASFGYFDAATNERVLRGLAERLRPGGRLVLDLTDRAFFEANATEMRHGAIRDAKTVRDGRLHTELVYEDDTRDTFDWQLYHVEELVELSGLDLVLACGDFDESREPGTAPRTQVVLERAT